VNRRIAGRIAFDIRESREILSFGGFASTGKPMESRFLLDISASIEMKERILEKVVLPKTSSGRYRPKDHLLEFLNNL
jgi:hypothetical protein